MLFAKLAIALLTGGGVVGVTLAPALAETTSDADVTHLMPLENRSFGVETDPNLLETVTEALNNSDEGVSENSFLTELLPDGIVDEEGTVDLPLGLTIFNTMGDTSVGFGGSF
jgi:hypothetical protein